MKQGKIGVQMMMLKQDIQQYGIYAALEKLADLGFGAVEVSQIAMTKENVQALARAQRELGVQVAAMSCGLEDISGKYKYPGDTLRNDLEKIIDDCRAVDCSILRIGMLPMSYAATPQRMLEMTDICEEYARRLKHHGIDLYYHAHNMEFFRWQGKPVLTHMRERTQCMGFELDSHWMWRGGVEPAAYIRSFAGRIRLLHLKDYRIGLVLPYRRSSSTRCLEPLSSMPRWAKAVWICPPLSRQVWRAAANTFSLSRTKLMTGMYGNPCVFPATI